jgi:hypothetical protein
MECDGENWHGASEADIFILACLFDHGKKVIVAWL